MLKAVEGTLLLIPLAHMELVLAQEGASWMFASAPLITCLAAVGFSA